MTAPAVGGVLYRTQARLEAAPPTTAGETRAVAVEPLLAALEWDPHGDGCDRDTTVAGETLEYLFSIDETPALAVAVEPYHDPLADDRWTALTEWMDGLGLAHGLYTNGRTVRLAVGNERAEYELLELTDEEGPLHQFTRSAVATQVRSDDHDRAAGRLAAEREALVDGVTEELTDAGGEELAETFERTAEEFVDRLIGLLADREPTSGRASGQEDVPRERPAQTDEGAEPETADAEEEASEHDPFAVVPDEPEGEYVAKFFDGSTTIGGIGDSTSAFAFEHAVEFLLERGLSGLRLPWGPENDEVVLNREPTLGDGDPMPAARELSNGLVLNVGGSVGDRARRLEALTSRAGLRVMLTGDWAETELESQ